MPISSDDGSVLQSVPESNYVGFVNTEVVPNVKINSLDNVSMITIITNSIDVFGGNIDIIGESMKVSTTLNFNFSEISFNLSQEVFDSFGKNTRQTHL